MSDQVIQLAGDNFGILNIAKISRNDDVVCSGGCEMSLLGPYPRQQSQYMTSHFYSYAYWIDAAYLVHNLLYPGPPDNEIYEKLFQRYGLRTEDVIEKFGRLDVEPMRMDHLLNGWESIKSLKVGCLL